MSASSSSNKDEVVESELSRASRVLKESQENFVTKTGEHQESQQGLDVAFEDLARKQKESTQKAQEVVDSHRQMVAAGDEWRKTNRERIKTAHQQGVKGQQIAKEVHNKLDIYQQENNKYQQENDKHHEEHKDRLDEHGTIIAEHDKQHEAHNNRLDEHETAFGQYVQQHNEHNTRIDQHAAALTEFKNDHDKLHHRIGKVEDKHSGHAQRMTLLERKHAELRSQQNWIGPLVLGLTATGIVASLWWIISKIAGGKKKDKAKDLAGGEGSDDETEDGSRKANNGRRGHARSWEIAPELRTYARHRGKYAEED